MEVLVTGGAGFIGSHIAERLVRTGHDVTIVDIMEPYYDLGLKRRNIEAVESATGDGGSVRVVEESVTDRASLDELIDGTDVVFHQAAQAGVRASVEEPLKVNSYNVVGTLELLDAARKEDVDRVVMASSSSVYGKPAYLPYDEEHPTQPVSPYGVSKLAAEHYARVYYEIYGLPTVSLRYFTVYGPRMRPNMAMTNFVSRCVHGEAPVIYGDGSQTRDFTYIEDVVAINEQLVGDDGADGEVLNIGSTDTIDILSLAKTIRDAVDPVLELEFDDPRAGDAQHTHADVSKATELLGYEPVVGIRAGVDRFIAWYRENRDWYDPLVRAS